MIVVVKKLFFGSKKVVFRGQFGSKKVVFRFNQPNNHGRYRALPIERFYNRKQFKKVFRIYCRIFYLFNALTHRKFRETNRKDKDEPRKKRKEKKKKPKHARDASKYLYVLYIFDKQTHKADLRR